MVFDIENHKVQILKNFYIYHNLSSFHYYDKMIKKVVYYTNLSSFYFS